MCTTWCRHTRRGSMQRRPAPVESAEQCRRVARWSGAREPHRGAHTFSRTSGTGTRTRMERRRGGATPASAGTGILKAAGTCTATRKIESSEDLHSHPEGCGSSANRYGWPTRQVRSVTRLRTGHMDANSVRRASNGGAERKQMGMRRGRRVATQIVAHRCSSCPGQCLTRCGRRCKQMSAATSGAGRNLLGQP